MIHFSTETLIRAVTYYFYQKGMLFAGLTEDQLDSARANTRLVMTAPGWPNLSQEVLSQMTFTIETQVALGAASDEPSRTTIESLELDPPPNEY